MLHKNHRHFINKYYGMIIIIHVRRNQAQARQPSKDPMIPCLVMYLRFDHGRSAVKKSKFPQHTVSRRVSAQYQNINDEYDCD